jgi:hypothetical protein
MEGELVIPERDLGRWKKAEDLRSIRDAHFNAAMGVFVPWVKSSASDGLPEWFAEATKTVHAWRATARLAALVIRWRSSRFAGDEEMFTVLEEWRRKDKHLYEWEANNRRKAIAWRDNAYRVFAAVLAARYAAVSVEDTDWSEVAKLPDADEEEEMVNPTARRNRTIAAVGRLHEILRERFRWALTIDARGTTERCTACGRMDAVPPDKVVRACRHCGYVEDRDRRAARNILAKGAK